jgi:hypothetical protein
LRIERIKQAVQGAGRDLVQVRLVHIFALNAVEHFAVDRESAESLVVGRAPTDVPHRHEPEDDDRQHDDNFLG